MKTSNQNGRYPQKNKLEEKSGRRPKKVEDDLQKKWKTTSKKWKMTFKQKQKMT